MVIDSSALLAILLEEDDLEIYLRAMENDEAKYMSVESFVESSIVIEKRRGSDGLVVLDQFIEKTAIELVPVDVVQAHAARSAYRIYGKGRHSAKLNFGDCFTYALAITLIEPLLFKGNDFSRTDVAQVLVQSS